MNEWKSTYDISLGDTIIKLVNNGIDKYESKASVQLDTPADFDGTTTQAYLVQSNVFNKNIAHWHPLPEAPLTLLTGAESALLSTFSFTAKFLAVVIIQGDATQGIISLNSNYNK